jgi:hypothetical protein
VRKFLHDSLVVQIESLKIVWRWRRLWLKLKNNKIGHNQFHRFKMRLSVRVCDYT